ncbi:MAG TPA: hypothetical protein VGM90_14715 [Kofleriaceae bacterium]|jgi:hypothetical protein
MTAYRNDVDALAHRHASLADELVHKTREVADASRLLDEAKAKARLPVLDNIRVATPCPADWNQMTGDDRVRACAQCKKDVFNLSGMTRDEAQSLMIEKNGELCVRYFQRKDGTILLKDCSIGISQKRKRRVIAAGVAMLLGGAALLVFKRPAPVKGHETIAVELVPLIPPPPADHEMMDVAGGIGPAPTEPVYAMMGAPPPAPRVVPKHTAHSPKAKKVSKSKKEEVYK